MRSPKRQEILHQIKQCVASGAYLFTNHATERGLQRGVELPDVLHVLKTGWHEKIKDTWDEKFQEWNYAIRGVTVDKSDIRIIVSLDDTKILVITVIRLVKDTKK